MQRVYFGVNFYFFFIVCFVSLLFGLLLQCFRQLCDYYCCECLSLVSISCDACNILKRPEHRQSHVLYFLPMLDSFSKISEVSDTKVDWLIPIEVTFVVKTNENSFNLISFSILLVFIIAVMPKRLKIADVLRSIDKRWHFDGWTEHKQRPTNHALQQCVA